MGTSVSLKLSEVRGPLTCHLVAVGKDGSQQTVSNWSVGKEGYDTSAQPEPLSLDGATGMQPDAIDHVDVVTTQGRRLVSVNL
ncbi:hypothetical protein ACWGKW_32080 [Streptomyces sp. NPDC054766]|uniref:hypothetical protein n=1 Tax=Streptomyces rhizosphaerihabitans TaxID=1266770 RepID=UPI0021C01C5B|nr:hypothetical protein [Streptomyces rhizosphaerihabitans]MCT9006129.1 hypothetical protein [Streptomyces rhizosphaerihabitans]